MNKFWPRVCNWFAVGVGAILLSTAFLKFAVEGSLEAGTSRKNPLVGMENAQVLLLTPA